MSAGLPPPPSVRVPTLSDYTSVNTSNSAAAAARQASSLLKVSLGTTGGSQTHSADRWCSPPAPATDYTHPKFSSAAFSTLTRPSCMAKEEDTAFAASPSLEDLLFPAGLVEELVAEVRRSCQGLAAPEDEKTTSSASSPLVQAMAPPASRGRWSAISPAASEPRSRSHSRPLSPELTESTAAPAATELSASAGSRPPRARSIPRPDDLPHPVWTQHPVREARPAWNQPHPKQKSRPVLRASSRERALRTQSPSQEKPLSRPVSPPRTAVTTTMTTLPATAPVAATSPRRQVTESEAMRQLRERVEAAERSAEAAQRQCGRLADAFKTLADDHNRAQRMWAASVALLQQRVAELQGGKCLSPTQQQSKSEAEEEEQDAAALRPPPSPHASVEEQQPKNTNENTVETEKSPSPDARAAFKNRALEVSPLSASEGEVAHGETPSPSRRQRSSSSSNSVLRIPPSPPIALSLRAFAK